MDKEYRYKVCTLCLTYNHSAYINDTLRGFAMQETSYPAVFIIVDDASTDGEQNVIKEWASCNLLIGRNGVIWQEKEYGQLAVCQLIGKTNSLFVILLLAENHYQVGKNREKFGYFSEWYEYSKYHALCEGDDYWIHPLKLQRQVEFMDDNADFSLCFCNALVSYDNYGVPATLFNNIGEDREIHLMELLDKWICPTPGILYRSSVRPFFPLKERIISGDWYMILHCAAKGKVWGMKEVMSCYRKSDNETSMSNSFSHRTDETFLKKVPILEGLDEYTEGRYHELIRKYVRYYTVFGKLVQFKKKHGMLATLIMRPFSIMEIVWKRSIRPRIDKKAPTFSA